MGKTRYYDPHDSTFKSMFTWHATIFELVFQRPEFYIYILWNIIITTVCIFWIEQGVIDAFNWDAASIMQYVMTFFVTFYNDKCYERYSVLYPACMDFMDNVVLLIQEMNVSLPWKDLHYHRIAVTKYLLAVIYEYFMIVCGGKLQTKSWKELVDKGLLSKEECKMLEQFPGGESTFVLTSWVLFVIRDALVQNCMWGQDPLKEQDPAHGWRKLKEDNPKDWQPQQTVHIFNRHCTYVVELQRACHKIGYTMANPIPFAYYHLMNVILVFNIMLLATFSALYRSYFSALPFAVALLVYMGLREISCALADPFGRDSIDFPIPDFVRQCFDNTVAQLLAFQRPDVRERILASVENVEDFKDHHLRRTTKPGLFRADDEPMKGTATSIRWTDASVFCAKHDIPMGKKIKYAFSAKELPEEKEAESGPKKNPHKEVKKKAIKETRAERKVHKELKAEIAALESEYNSVLSTLDKLIDRYPKLHDKGPAVYVPEHLAKERAVIQRKEEEKEDGDVYGEDDLPV